ncbi:MAG: DUF1566 domain-containing protein [Comamonadaceae bacterium]|nr:DUF1566 domain-containing protein [Comamonadaceae bacterium]
MKSPECILLPAKPCRPGVCSATLALSLSLAWPAWAAAPFTVNGNGTVTDTMTSLVWDQCILGRTGSACLTDTAGLYDWPGALAAAVAANAASYKGFTDWRVPNVNELESITKLDTWTSGKATIDADAFPNTPVTGDVVGYGGTWTSTTWAPNPRFAWIVNFYDGYTDGSDKWWYSYVRLVRSGQSLASSDLLGSPPDTTRPVTTAAPTLSGSPTARTAGISVTINEAGTGYWLLVPSAATAPTSEQVVAGVNYAGVTVVRSGNTAMTAATPASISLSGLTPGTAYKLYFVAKDTANNLQASPSSVAVTTAAQSTDLTPILMLLLD